MNEADCNDLEAASNRLAGALRFTDIPRTTRLFNDFLYDYDKVRRFYTDCGRTVSPLAKHAREVGSRDFDRKQVPDALERINRSAGSGELTFQHIDILRKPGSVAIVTGQQAGLFTGPLYTIYKALTAIKLASELRVRGVNAVPIFWIASEDHDFEEVNHCRLVNRDGQLITVSYTACSPKEGRPVGTVQLCDDILQDIDEVVAALPESEFVNRLAADLRESYKPGTGFADAFGKLVMRIFEKYGLPDAILSDNGTPFASTGLARLSNLSVWWIRLGIQPILSQPGQPQQNGRHERMHLTLKKEATKPTAANVLQREARFDAFMARHNEDRPHQALGMKAPANFYVRSPRPTAASMTSPIDFTIRRSP